MGQPIKEWLSKFECVVGGKKVKSCRKYLCHLIFIFLIFHLFYCYEMQIRYMLMCFHQLIPFYQA